MNPYETNKEILKNPSLEKFLNCENLVSKGNTRKSYWQLAGTANVEVVYILDNFHRLIFARIF
jgi:hypothetical protein